MRPLLRRHPAIAGFLAVLLLGIACRLLARQSPVNGQGSPVAGGGYPQVVAKADWCASGCAQGVLSGTIAPFTLYTCPNSGTYRVSQYLVITQAATTSSTLPDVLVTWTDNDSNTSVFAQTTNTTTGNAVGINTSNLSVGNAGVLTIQCKAGTAITPQTTGYLSSGAAVLQYAAHFKVEYLGQ